MQPNALFRHSCTVYAALDKAANEETVGQDTVKVFRGSVTALFSNTSISNQYYTRIFMLLEQNNCITRLQQGARGVDSVIVVHEPPRWEAWSEDGLQKPLTTDPTSAKLEARVKELEKRLGGLDIVEALANHEERLRTLEQQKPKTRGKADKA